MARELPFSFEMPVSFFEKADAPDGQQRRIGGIASLESKDKQDEELLARGLDFTEFVDDGWFNDNHSKKTDDILGYPEGTNLFKKGDKLPSGEHAPAAGHWVEGYLLEGHPPADRIWTLGKALAKTRRRLGFSVEGKVLKRAGVSKSGGKVVARAKVRNVAITNCPVHPGAHMEVLAKSLQAVTDSDDSEETTLIQRIHEKVERMEERVEKALTMGTATGIRPPEDPQTGEGAGQVITGQSLEQKKKPPRVVEAGSTFEDEDEDGKKTKKSLSDAEAFAFVQTRLPLASEGQVWRIIETTRKLKAQNKL